MKPDTIIMKVSNMVGIVASVKGNRNFVRTVQEIQEYSIQSNYRPAEIDLYFLIEGGQKEAIKLIHEINLDTAMH